MVPPTNIAQYIKMVSDVHALNARTPIRTPHQLLLEYGQTFAPTTTLPRGVKPGAVSHCFWNAYSLAVRGRGKYRYVEGLAFRIIPVEHAWCITADGTVVDPTWRAIDPVLGENDDREYFGIPIRLNYVRRIITPHCFNVLWNYTKQWPMLRDAPEEWSA